MAKLAQKVKLWLHHSSTISLSVQMSMDWTYMWICETVCMLLFYARIEMFPCTQHTGRVHQSSSIISSANDAAGDKIKLPAFFTDHDSTGNESELWLLLAAHGGKSEALMAAHCGQGGIMAPFLCRCGFKQLLPVVAILLWDNFGKLEKLRLSECESSPSRGSSKLNIKPGNWQFAGLALRKSMKSRGGS